MSKIKKFAPRVLSAVLSLIIVCSGVGVAAYSAGAESTGTNAKTDAKISEKADKTDISADTPKKLSKNETVYVIANADGSAQKIIVSDWIKNTESADKIDDFSRLKDIKNVKGEEKYVMDSTNMYTWDADGNDIYYQGNCSEELPVELSITYTLDGKKVSPDSLAGKKGKLKMRFDYENKQYEEVKINGKKEKIYVPFVMLTGMLFDNDKFRNIEVSNGKVINDGSHTCVAGFAMPGMQESLDIDKKDFEIPDYVEITADVSDFELSTTLTLAANEMFSDIDFSDADKTVEDLSSSLEEMTDATDRLLDGSSQLYSGLNTLLDKSGDLINGIQQLSSGAQQLNEGANLLDSGALSLKNGASLLNSGANSLDSGAASVDAGVAELRGYISNLSGGLSRISANSAELNKGAKQVFDTLLSTADTQLAASGISADKLTIDNYPKVLGNIQNSLSEDKVQRTARDTALATVTSTVKGQESVIREAVEAEVRKQVTEGVLAAAGYSMTSEQYEAALASGEISDEVQAQVTSAVAVKMSSDSIQTVILEQSEAKIQSLIDENMNSEEVWSQINAAVEKAKAGAKSISALKGQLDSYNQFYQGILQYTSGVDAASEGAKQILSGTGTLKDGTSSLKDGANQLKNGAGSLESGAGTLKNGTSSLKDGSNALANGIESLSSGSGALKDGVKQLDKGAMSLNKGLKQFKDEGVQTLVDAVDGDIKGLMNRLKAISKVSSNYKSYSGISEDMDGKVDFIFRTEAVEK